LGSLGLVLDEIVPYLEGTLSGLMIELFVIVVSGPVPAEHNYLVPHTLDVNNTAAAGVGVDRLLVGVG
jgi:hypothetical protein